MEQLGFDIVAKATADYMVKAANDKFSERMNNVSNDYFRNERVEGKGHVYINAKEYTTGLEDGFSREGVPYVLSSRKKGVKLDVAKGDFIATTLSGDRFPMSGDSLSKNYTKVDDSSTDHLRVVGLWSAVISRAQDDSICNDMLICNDEEMDQAEDTQTNGINWFKNNGNDFRDVCDLCLLDSGAVRSYAKKSMMNNKVIDSDWVIDKSMLSRGLQNE